MKKYKKLISLIITTALILTVISTAAVTVYAAEISVSSCEELVSVLNSGLSDSTTVKLTADISANSDIELKNASKATLALNGHTLSLGDNHLKLTDVSGLTYIVGSESSAVGGKIEANGDAVIFSGTAGTLTVGNNVTISSANGNGIVNATSGRSMTLTGVKISAPNGCGVLLTSNQNLVYSANEIQSADKRASSLLINFDNYNIFTDISAKKCIAVSVLENATAYNVNKSGVKASVTLRYGALLNGSEAVIGRNDEHLYVTGDNISYGLYSENISADYGVAINNSYTLLRDGKMFAVFNKSDIGSVDSEESLAQALQSGGAYYIKDDFTVSGNTSITAAADTVLEGQGYKVTFNGSGTYLSCESGIDYQLTISNLSLDGGNSVDSFFGKTESDLNVRDGNIYFYGCDSDNFINGALSFNYKLSADCVLGNTFEVNEGEKIEVDLNGFTVTAPSPAFSVSGSLTIKDTQSGGKVISQNPIEKSVNGSVKVYGGVFDAPIYDYTATDTSVFNIRNNDGTDGVYSDASVLRSAVTKGANDVFPYDSLSNLETLGIEEKITGNLKTNDITAQGIRVVTVVNEGLLKSSNIADYGYLVARLDSDRTIGELDFNRLRVGVWNGEKRISCVNSSNGLSGDYGTYEADTRYKYVTLAVNGMESGDKIVARFYIKTSNGKYYYANYKTYGGILAEYKG